MFEPSTFTDWAGLLAILTTLLVASVSGLWAVRVRSQENARAEWRRVEELVQIVHYGSAKGLWAQKLAVAELLSLKRHHDLARRILREAAEHFRTTGASGSTLANYIEDKLGPDR